jgi:flavin-dependent dehydrogenase
MVLARAGVKVRLIDRASFPRDKMCGDTLNPGSLAILARFGANKGVDVHRRVTTRALPIRGMIVTGPGGASITADYPLRLQGASLTRRDFDAMLLDAAIRAGAEFTPGVTARAPIVRERADDQPAKSYGGPPELYAAEAAHFLPQDAAHAAGAPVVEGVRVSTPAGDEEWRAPIVIAADGRHSSIAFALGLARYAAWPRRWAFGAYFQNVRGLGQYGEMHIRRDGYVGVAPLPGGIANLCVVREMFSAGFRMNAEKTIASAIASDAGLRERFARARRVSPITTLGPLAVDARAAGCPGLLLAGDAAGFIDPMTGDGLRFALRGGALAAEAALRELESGEPAFESLAHARAQEFKGKWRVNRVLRSIVGSPRAVELAASVSSRWDTPVRLLVGIAGDVHLATALSH